MTATNGIGWVVEEYYGLTTGWKQSMMFPIVYKTQEQAEEVYCSIVDKGLFRVYEALSDSNLA